MNRVQALTGRAIDTLEELLDAREHPSVRLGAARTAELAIHQPDAEAIMQRLGEIEAFQHQQEAGGRR